MNDTPEQLFATMISRKGWYWLSTNATNVDAKWLDDFGFVHPDGSGWDPFVYQRPAFFKYSMIIRLIIHNDTKEIQAYNDHYAMTSRYDFVR